MLDSRDQMVALANRVQQVSPDLLGLRAQLVLLVNRVTVVTPDHLDSRACVVSLVQLVKLDLSALRELQEIRVWLDPLAQQGRLVTSDRWVLRARLDQKVSSVILVTLELLALQVHLALLELVVPVDSLVWKVKLVQKDRVV
jgi:hypothetical protein